MTMKIVVVLLLCAVTTAFVPVATRTIIAFPNPSKNSAHSASLTNEKEEIEYIENVGDEIVPLVVTEQEDIIISSHSSRFPVIDKVLDSYWGPRIILGAIPVIYGTNFALGSLMNDSLPSSVVTASRMTLAAATLSPWMLQISPNLLNRAILTGMCTATGYVTQSLALTDTDPSRVAFLGCATVLWCPLLEYFVDRRDVSWKAAPQLWLAAILCMLGVGILELDASSLSATFSAGDGLAILQAVGFGTGCFLSAKLVREEPKQVLPVTSVLIGVSAVLSWIWCAFTVSDFSTLPNLLDPSMQSVLLAILWTGMISTSFNFVVEISALSRVPTSEAAVLLATEPIWAALFANFLIGETLGLSDYIGGGFIIGACLVNAILKPKDLQRLFGTDL